MKRLLLAILFAAAASPVPAAITAQGISIVDITGTPRTVYGSNETISFFQRIQNTVAGSGNVVFQFQITSPSGALAFLQTGNAVPGRIGNSQSSMSGISISRFFTVPGVYTLTATASFNGQNVTQTETFTVSSPNIVLTYPPNGSQNLTDNPITFRWVSSGGSSYRVTVGDNPSFYNALFAQTTPLGQGFLTYPTNPPDPRQRLTTGQAYYWKVDALDTNNNVVATSQPPFSFTVANAALTRDLAVVSLTINGQADAQGNIPFQVVVKDQGSTTESNVPLTFALGGLTAPGSPVTIASISPGASQTFNFSAAPPPGQSRVLAVSCLQFFDDVMSNNCMSIAMPGTTSGVSSSTGTSSGASGNLTNDQLWQQILSLLQQQGYDLSQYQLTSIESTLSNAQLQQLLNQLQNGQAQVNLSGPPLPAAPTFVPTPTGPALALAPQEGQEWSGLALPLSRSVRTFTVTEDDVWQKLWPRFSPDPVPPVDFGRYSVVGIIGGKFDNVASISIYDVSRGRGGLQVLYTLSGEREIESLSKDGRSMVPYLLHVAPFTPRDAQFKEVKDKGSR